jgi:predicted RNA-binding protein with PIN domain
MTPIPLRISVSALFAAAALFLPAIIQAQIPGGTSAREIPTEVQKTDARVDQVIERANDHFRKGKLNLEDNKREQARDEFV